MWKKKFQIKKGEGSEMDVNYSLYQKKNNSFIDLLPNFIID